VDVRGFRALSAGLTAGAWLARAAALVAGCASGFSLVRGQLTWSATFGAFALAFLLTAWRLDDRARRLSRRARTAALPSARGSSQGTDRT
jgi:hypothetical protein